MSCMGSSQAPPSTPEWLSLNLPGDEIWSFGKNDNWVKFYAAELAG